MKNKNIIIKAGVIITLLLFMAPSMMADTDTRPPLQTGYYYTGITELDGCINATVHQTGLETLVYPEINILPHNITIDAHLNETYYVVNHTLRINIEVYGSTSAVVGRYLNIIVVLQKTGVKLLPFDSMINRVFLGKPFHLYSVNIITVGDKYIDIPLSYTTDTDNDTVNIYLLVLGSPMLKILTGSERPVMAIKKVPVTFAYNELVKDIIPPVTTCNLSGNVTATLSADDENSGVDYTMYRYRHIVGGLVAQTEWGYYTEPVEFKDNGEYTMDYYSVDRAENTENVTSTSWVI